MRLDLSALPVQRAGRGLRQQRERRRVGSTAGDSDYQSEWQFSNAFTSAILLHNLGHKHNAGDQQRRHCASVREIRTDGQWESTRRRSGVSRRECGMAGWQYRHRQRDYDGGRPGCLRRFDRQPRSRCWALHFRDRHFLQAGRSFLRGHRQPGGVFRSLLRHPDGDNQPDGSADCHTDTVRRTAGKYTKYPTQENADADASTNSFTDAFTNSVRLS